MSDLKEVGALWSRTKGEKTYYTGNININGTVIELRVFKNDYKKSDKHPDLKVFITAPDDQPAPQHEPTIDITNPRNQSVLPEYPDEPIDPSDIPF